MSEKGWSILTVREGTAKRVKETAHARGLTVDISKGGTVVITVTISPALPETYEFNIVWRMRGGVNWLQE